MDTKKCPKCEGEMVKGVIKGSGIVNIISKQFWTTKIKMLTDTDIKYISTYCCSKCGYLESYAT